MKNHLSVCFALILTTVLLRHNKMPFIKIAVKASGDTIEYKVSAYTIQPNDKLADLLKRLPAVELDKNDIVYAQGDAVQKLLIDGEDFFGDSPSIGLHNIRADQVDKIQFYFKLSDQASFIDVEDKVRIKTINVLLKKDKSPKK